MSLSKRAFMEGFLEAAGNSMTPEQAYALVPEAYRRAVMNEILDRRAAELSQKRGLPQDKYQRQLDAFSEKYLY